MKLPCFTIALIALFLSNSAFGEVITVHHFRLGEDDESNVYTAPAVSRDSITGAELVMPDGRHYSQDRPGVNSSVSLFFNGAQLATTKLTAPLTGEFGAEVWVKTSSENPGGYVLLVGQGASGWGLRVDELGKFHAFLGGQMFGEAPAAPELWTHLALFCDGKSTTFYVNGVASGTGPALPNSPADTRLTLATMFRGGIDEVRLFTPWHGGFTPEDLLYTDKDLTPVQVKVVEDPMPVAKLASAPKSLTVGPLTVLRYFKLGEADPGVVAGAAATASVDSASSNPLTLIGNPLYSADSPQYNGELTVDFSAPGSYGSTANPDALTTNFGVEVWVKPAGTDGTRFILYSGDPGSSGWGIFQNAATGKFGARFGGGSDFGEGDIQVGVWTHLAFVVTGGTATFYVNGAPSGASVAVNPSAPASTLFVGVSPALGEFFGGNIDDVRIFTFAEGAFTPSLLLYRLRVPLTFMREGSNATLAWPLDYPRFSLETTTDLAIPWQPVYAPNRVAGNFTVTQSVNPHRFYRLKRDAGAAEAPRLAEGKFIVITSQGVNKNVTNYSAAYANRIDGWEPSAIDARAFIDPGNPNGTHEDLVFHWTVNYPLVDRYNTAGMTGYHSPVLSAVPNSYAQQPNQPNTQVGGAYFYIEVYSPVTGLTSETRIDIQINRSGLKVYEYINCELVSDPAEVCVSCPCPWVAAMPEREEEI